MADDRNAGAPQGGGAGGSVLSGTVMGMPMWVWGVGVGGVLVFLWWRHRAASSPSGQSGAGGITYATDPGTGLPIDPHTGLPYVSSQGGSPTTLTLDGWVHAAESALAGAGYKPGAISRSLYSYLNGLPMTAAQAAVITKALQLTGYPPGELLPFNLRPSPHPPKPPSTRVVPPKPTGSPGKGKEWWFTIGDWKWVPRLIPKITKPPIKRDPTARPPNTPVPHLALNVNPN